MEVFKIVKKHSIICVIALMLVSLLISQVPLRNIFEKFCTYPNAIILEGLCIQGGLSLLVYLLMRRYSDISFYGLKFEKKLKDLYVIWPFIVLILINAVGNIRVIQKLNLNFISVILYVLMFCTTGILEEFLIRGAALKAFIKRYGATKKGLIKAAILSNVVLSLAHISGYFTGQADLLVVSVQIINEICFGILYAAIFLRTNTLWLPVILHALIEISGNVQVLGITSRAELDAVITGNTMTVGVAIQGIFISLPFLLFGLFFLRKVST